MARKKETQAKAKRKARKTTLPTSFAVQVDNYLTYCTERNLKESTIDSYVFYLTYLKSFLMSNRHCLLVDYITEEDMKAFFNQLRDSKKNSQNTINSAISTLRPFFNYLVSEKVINENPMAKIRKGKVDKKPIIPFTDEEFELLKLQPDKSTFVGHRDCCIMLMLISTGMRISECLNLKIGDIKFKENMILINVSKNRQPRIAGLSARLKPFLQKYINACLPDSLQTDYLFPNHDGEKLQPRSIQQNIKKYGKKAKITSTRVSPHTFRHTYAIKFLKNGGSTASLREQLGHRTISTVEKYLYWSMDDKLEQFKKYNPLDNMEISL